MQPNFILLDNNSTLKSIEEILIEFNQPMFHFGEAREIGERSKQLMSTVIDLKRLSNINFEDFEELLTLIGRFEDLESVVASIKMSTTSARNISYNYNGIFPEVTGPSEINCINYQLYFLLKFYMHKDAFVNILKYEVKVDEFGKPDLTKWDKKFGKFFVDHLFDLSIETDGSNFLKIKNYFSEDRSWSPKMEKYKNFNYLVPIYENVKDFYLEYRV